MNVGDAYDAWAAGYDADRNLTRDLDAAALRELGAGRRWRAVLEAGCGTGKNTAFYAGAAAAVLAVDFSPGMLAVARAKITAANVAFAAADLTARWPAADRAHDLVAFHLVLEHVLDLAPVFAEAARCLAPGGEVLVAELHPFRQYLGGKARFTGTDGAVREIAAHVHHVSDFVQSAAAAGLRLRDLREWWHGEDGGKPPRLLTLGFVRG